MTQTQTYSEKYNIKYLSSEADQNINDVIRMCAAKKTSVLNNEGSDEEYFLVPLLAELMETFVTKFSSEVSGITETINKIQRDRYKALFDQFKALGKSVTKQNNYMHKEINNVENPEIHELISEGIDVISIGQFLTSVMEPLIIIEIRKCLLMSKTASTNEGHEEEYIPVSILEGLMEALVVKFSSDASVVMVKMISDQEAEFDALFVNFEANVKGFTKEKRDLIKQRENIKIFKTQELSSKEKVIDVNNCDVADFKDRTINTLGLKKKCSSIFRFTNRNKNYEILSTKK